jgi:diacylglycerol kinase (ATP)
MRLLVVHKANAGDDGDREALAAALKRAGHTTSSVCKGQAEIRQAIEEAPDAVVVLGGDGSVTAVARELIDTDIPIVPVPAGTANNVALFLGAGEDPLPALQRGRRRALDMGVCDFTGGGATKVFLEGAGWGPFPDAIALLAGLDADAMVDGREDELERDSGLLKEVAARAPARWCSLELDGGEQAGCFLLVELLNIGNVGPNLRLAPDADPSDGLLDVVVVDEVERSELQAYLTVRIADRALPSPFSVRRARQIRMRIDEPTRLHVDDQLVEREGPLEVTISVRPRAVSFLI